MPLTVAALIVSLNLYLSEVSEDNLPLLCAFLALIQTILTKAARKQGDDFFKNCPKLLDSSLAVLAASIDRSRDHNPTISSTIEHDSHFHELLIQKYASSILRHLSLIFARRVLESVEDLSEKTPNEEPNSVLQAGKFLSQIECGHFFMKWLCMDHLTENILCLICNICVGGSGCNSHQNPHYFVILDDEVAECLKFWNPIKSIAAILELRIDALHGRSDSVLLDEAFDAVNCLRNLSVNCKCRGMGIQWADSSVHLQNNHGTVGPCYL